MLQNEPQTTPGNEPLPDPQSLSAIDRVKIINSMREEQNNGIEHSETQLSWMLSLLVLERQAATGRGSRSSSASAPSTIPTSLDDL